MPEFIALCNQQRIVTGIPISSIINLESAKNHCFQQVDHFFYRLPNPTLANDEITAGNYLTYYVHARYDETRQVYQQLLSELKKRHYQICSDVYQEYLVDEDSSAVPGEYVLRVMMQVAPAK